MNFEELKQKAKKELEEAIQKQKELIKKLSENLDDINKFDKGNVIVGSQGEYYIIVDIPVVVKEHLRVPIRHNVYPIMDASRCLLNMSGCVDIVEIPLSKIKSVEVISVRDVFNRERSKLIEIFQANINDSKRYISKIQRVIKEKQNDIKRSEEYVKKAEAYDFNGNFESAIDNYLKSGRFVDDAFDMPTGYNEEYKTSKKLHVFHVI
jgi:glutaredoxin 2